MLVKAEDRMTADGLLMLRAFASAGPPLALKTFLDNVRALSPRSGELLFHEDPSEGIRFFGNENGLPKTLSVTEAQSFFFPEPGTMPVLLPVTFSLSTDAVKRDEFLASEAHEDLAFTREPLLLLHIPGKEPKVAAAREGRVGRKYVRSKNEVLDFLRSHPEGSSLFSDIEYRFSHRVSIISFEDLSHFIKEDGSSLDIVIDAVWMVSGYYFEAEAFGPAIAEKKEWFFEQNKNSYATVDFHLYPSGSSTVALAPISEEAASSDLRAALSDISRFAAENKEEDYRTVFEKQLQKLDQLPEEPWPLFTLNRLSPAAYRLFRAAIGADVFAGMASWNDVQIDKTPAYRKVSNQLCLALLNAICASCSSGL